MLEQSCKNGINKVAIYTRSVRQVLVIWFNNFPFWLCRAHFINVIIIMVLLVRRNIFWKFTIIANFYFYRIYTS
jgi:hypothetical protein